MHLKQIRKPHIPRRAIAPAVVLAAVLAGAYGSTPATAGTARSARSGSFRETGHLKKTSRSGASFTEQGPASGTYSGSLTLYLTTTSKGVTFRMAGGLHGGTLSGHGSATMNSEGKIATVHGTAAITGGSGRYAHAHGALKVEGTFNRETYSLVVTLAGRLAS